MSAKKANSTPSGIPSRTFPRFTIGQRWEHAVLLLTGLALILTGLPQKYREYSLSLDLLSTPEQVFLIRQIHHIAAIILSALVVYHLGRILVLLSRRSLPGDLLPNMQDVLDAWHVIQYLFFIRQEKPKFGRYNFEQKVTYWFVFFGIGIMVVSGFIVWFPVQVTHFLPGGVVPAAKLAHSTESVVMSIFIVIWHIYHVHVERLNLSIFTGHLSEDEMRKYHQREYERFTVKLEDGK